MVKEIIKIYIEREDKRRLLQKAEEMGFVNRGSLNLFMTFIARNDVLLLDNNCKKMLKALGQ